MTNTNTTTTITERINNFDNWYMMTDDHSRYNKWSFEKRQLNEIISTLSDEQIKEVYNGLDEKGLSSDFAKDLKERIDSMKIKEVETVKESPKRTIMLNAWELFRTEEVETFSEALKLSWRRYKIVSALKSGVAYFAYQNAKGEHREAIGTLRNGNFDYTPKTNGKKSSLTVVKYFDIEKRAFRSFRIERLIAS